MSSHNICIRQEIRKICGYPLLSVAMKYFFLISPQKHILWVVTEVLLMGTCNTFFVEK